MRRAWLLVALLFAAVACSPGGGAVESTTSSGEAAAWRTAPLRDVRTGETFRIDDLQGALVVIEPMAIWCTTCRAQQREAAAALSEVGGDDVVYISLGVDPNEAEADLARYADEQGFGWRFAVASPQVARSLADSFGEQVLSPPSTPGIIVRPDGAVEGVSFGIKKAEQLVAEFREHAP